jgi:hypothetical protein
MLFILIFYFPHVCILYPRFPFSFFRIHLYMQLACACSFLKDSLLPLGPHVCHSMHAILVFSNITRTNMTIVLDVSISKCCFQRHISDCFSRCYFSISLYCLRNNSEKQFLYGTVCLRPALNFTR